MKNTEKNILSLGVSKIQNVTLQHFMDTAA